MCANKYRDPPRSKCFEEHHPSKNIFFICNHHPPKNIIFVCKQQRTLITPPPPLQTHSSSTEEQHLGTNFNARAKYAKTRVRFSSRRPKHVKTIKPFYPPPNHNSNPTNPGFAFPPRHQGVKPPWQGHRDQMLRSCRSRDVHRDLQIQLMTWHTSHRRLLKARFAAFVGRWGKEEVSEEECFYLFAVVFLGGWRRKVSKKGIFGLGRIGQQKQKCF